MNILLDVARHSCLIRHDAHCTLWVLVWGSHIARRQSEWPDRGNRGTHTLSTQDKILRGLLLAIPILIALRRAPVRIEWL